MTERFACHGPVERAGHRRTRQVRRHQPRVESSRPVFATGPPTVHLDFTGQAGVGAHDREHRLPARSESGRGSGLLHPWWSQPGRTSAEDHFPGALRPRLPRSVSACRCHPEIHASASARSASRTWPGGTAPEQEVVCELLVDGRLGVGDTGGEVISSDAVLVVRTSFAAFAAPSEPEAPDQGPRR